jgi:hypothetical protein
MFISRKEFTWIHFLYWGFSGKPQISQQVIEEVS